MYYVKFSAAVCRISADGNNNILDFSWRVAYQPIDHCY